MTIKAKHSRKRTRIQERNEKRILDAGLEVFATFGFRGSTIDQIADKAEMSKPNLLYYFPSKQAIYVSVLERTLEYWLEPLAQLDPNGDPTEEIWGYIERKLAMSKSAPLASRLFANEILQGAPRIEKILAKDLKPLVEEKGAVVETWIEQGKLNPVDPVHLFYMIWAATQHYADFQAQIDTLSPGNRGKRFETASETLKTIFLGGLLPRS
ncbi:MAG: TetR family transcriptional regulator C-terminal domain-containing protein [Hyphomicrobiales bacterium]